MPRRRWWCRGRWCRRGGRRGDRWWCGGCLRRGRCGRHGGRRACRRRGTPRRRRRGRRAELAAGGLFRAAGALAAGALAADALLFDFFFFDFFFFLGVVELTTGSGSTPPRRRAAAARLRARRGVHLASASANKHASTRAHVACLIFVARVARTACFCKRRVRAS